MTAPNLVDEQFARTIRDEREARAITQARLAKLMTACGFPWFPQTVQRIESGGRRISVGEAAGLAAILHLDISLAKLGAVLEVREPCTGCDDEPPRGFTCNTCGRSAT